MVSDRSARHTRRLAAARRRTRMQVVPLAYCEKMRRKIGYLCALKSAYAATSRVFASSGALQTSLLERSVDFGATLRFCGGITGVGGRSWRRTRPRKGPIRANVYPRNATGRSWCCMGQSQTADFLQQTTMFLRSSTRERDSQLCFGLSFQISREYWNNRSASWACDSATTTPAKLGKSPLKTAGALARRPHDRAN